MNFNPNSYGAYSYYGGSPTYMTPQPQPQPQYPQPQGLNGKIVENEEIVKVTEVPIGGYGVFPKADLTEIYVKTWNNNSKKMDMFTYKLCLNENAEPSIDIPTEILKRVESLEQKLDNLFTAGASVKEFEAKTPASKGGVKDVF